MKKNSLPNFLLVVGWKIAEFIVSLNILTLCEMPTAFSRIWSRIILNNSKDNNRLTAPVAYWSLIDPSVENFVSRKNLCKESDYRKTSNARVEAVTNELRTGKNTSALWNYIYTDTYWQNGQSRSSWSHNRKGSQAKPESSLSAIHRVGSGSHPRSRKSTM